jgi:hypothetical protein
MSTAALTLQPNDAVNRLVEEVARASASRYQRGASTGGQSSGGSRDPGEDMTGSTTAQDSQRFFGAILSGIVQHVVPSVAQGVLGLLQQRRRELGLPEQRDVERDFESILTAILPKLIDAVPAIVTAFAGQPAPRSTEEEAERFLPLLGALIPAVVSAVPSIISAFNRQRGIDAPPPPITDPDVAERFLGPLLGLVVPQVLQHAPSILNSIFGPRREITGSTW